MIGQMLTQVLTISEQNLVEGGPAEALAQYRDVINRKDGDKIFPVWFPPADPLLNRPAVGQASQLVLKTLHCRCGSRRGQGRSRRTFSLRYVKFSPKGGRVLLEARRDGEMVEIAIADQGIGIPAGALDKLFGKFYRVDNTETRKIGGTGLGLSIVKRIIDAHGGAIRVESTIGQFTRIVFTLLAFAPAAAENG